MPKPIPEPLASLSLEKVLETIPSGLFVVDTRQRIVSWNAEAERITGYGADEAVGRHCSFLAGIPCSESCGLFDAETPKPIIGVPCTILTKTGQRVTIAKNVDLLRDATGKIIGGIESFVDITRQRQLEQRLRRHSRDLEQAVRERTAELEQERTRLATVLDTMVDPAFIAGPDFRIRFINRAMARIFGEVVGRSCYRAFHDLADPCPWCPMPRVLAGETVTEERFFEINHRTYEIIHTPLHGSHGGPEKLAVHRDITARKQAEEKMREANRELDAFVYTVSHDLRSPLTPVIGFAEFLRDEYGDQLDAQGVELLGEIESQGQKMLSLLEDLLTLSRVGRLEPPSRPLPVRAAVDEALERYSKEINDKQLEVRVGELPELWIAETLLDELFANLIENAVRYGCQCGDRLEIDSRPAGDDVLLFVRDHGPGIPEAERRQVFDPFFRGSSAEGTPGTGIGLATVRKIARLYEGQCWVEETPGGGATVLVQLPLQPPPPAGDC